jgi:hypothetical protein
MATSGKNPKKRNGLAGTKKGTSDSAKYLHTHPAARAKKEAYDKKYHQTEKRKVYRAELNKANRNAGTYGNGDGKDMSHDSRGNTSKESQSANRARNGRGDNARVRRAPKKR